MVPQIGNTKSIHPSSQPSEDFDIGMLVSAGVFPDSFLSITRNLKVKSREVRVEATKEPKILAIFEAAWVMSVGATNLVMILILAPPYY